MVEKLLGFFEGNEESDEERDTTWSSSSAKIINASSRTICFNPLPIFPLPPQCSPPVAFLVSEKATVFCLTLTPPLSLVTFTAGARETLVVGKFSTEELTEELTRDRESLG